jgi:hypothetical protein
VCCQRSGLLGSRGSSGESKEVSRDIEFVDVEDERRRASFLPFDCHEETSSRPQRGAIA